MKLNALLGAGLMACALVAPLALATPRIGEAAPAFTAVDSNGRTVKLSDFAGRTVVME